MQNTCIFVNMRTQGSYPLLNKKFKDFQGLHSMPKKPWVHFFFSYSTTSNFILMVFLCLVLLVLENPGWIKLALKFKDFPAPTAIFKDFQRLSRCVRTLKTRKCLRVVSLSLLSQSTVCPTILTFYFCTTQPSATNKGQRSSSRSQYSVVAVS